MGMEPIRGRAMMGNSDWNNHLQKAIKAWSLARAKDLVESRRLPAPHNPQECERFLYEVLVDALMIFNDTYNEHYNQHVVRLEEIIRDYVNYNRPPTILDPEPIRNLPDNQQR